MNNQTSKHIALSLLSNIEGSGGDGSVSLWLKGGTMESCKNAAEKIAKMGKEIFPHYNWEAFHFKTEHCEYWGVHSQEMADIGISHEGFIFDDDGDVCIRVWDSWFNLENQ